MRVANGKREDGCKRIRQFSIALCLFIICFAAFAEQERSPANFVQDDQMSFDLGGSQEIWINQAMKEDSKGYYDELRNAMDKWQKREEFLQTWNINNNDVYEISNESEQKKFLMKKGLKYLDSRLSGEVKKAKVGSTLHAVGQAQKKLRPSSQVALSKNFKLKMKARVIQGKAYAILKNPYVDNSLEVSIAGKAKLWVGKKIPAWNVKSEINYNVNNSTVDMNMVKTFKDINAKGKIALFVNEGRAIASVEKSLARNLSGVISSEHTGSSSAQAVEVIYQRNF